MDSDRDLFKKNYMINFGIIILFIIASPLRVRGTTTKSELTTTEYTKRSGGRIAACRDVPPAQ